MLNHNYIGTEHLLLGLIHEGEGVAAAALESLGIGLEPVRQQVEEIIGQGEKTPSGHIPFTPRAKKCLELSLREALVLGHNYIGTEHILLGLIREGEGVAAQVLVRLGADLNRVRHQVIQLLYGYRGREPENPETRRSRFPRSRSGAIAEGIISGEPPEPFELFLGEDIATRLPGYYSRRTSIGRQKELEQVLQVLYRKTRNNPLLVSESYAGRTAILNGLAESLLNNQPNSSWRSKGIYKVKATLFTEDDPEDLQSPAKKLLRELDSRDDVIVYIEDLHELFSDDSSKLIGQSIATFHSLLHRGKIQIIGATTPELYRQHFEASKPAQRSLQAIYLPNLTAAETAKALKNRRDQLNERFKVRITDEALHTIAALAPYLARSAGGSLASDAEYDLAFELAESDVDPDWDQITITEAFRLLDHVISTVPHYKLGSEILELRGEKEAAIARQHFEQAAELRDREKRLIDQLASSPPITVDDEAVMAAAGALIDLTAADIGQIADDLSATLTYEAEGQHREEAYVLLNDEPLKGPAGDLLGTDNVAEGIASLLAGSRAQAPFVLAIDAGWGMGKSTLLRQIETRLKAYPGLATVRFNAWTADEASAIEGLIKSVLVELDTSLVRRWVRRLSAQRNALIVARIILGVVSRFLGVTRLVDELWNQLAVDARSRNALRDVIKTMLREWVNEGSSGRGRRSLVVFIDDLDRCSQRVIVQLCEAVKLYLDAPGLIFVIACDLSVIARGSSPSQDNAEDAGRAYLEKIVQVVHRLPPPDSGQLGKLIRGYAQRSGTEALIDHTITRILIDSAGRNPRRIKRIINSIVLENRLNPAWSLPPLSREQLVIAILLQHLYPSFYEVLLDEASGMDPIGNFLDYLTIRGRVSSLPDAGDSWWDVLERAFAQYAMAVTGRSVENLETLRDQLAELEGRVPEQFAELVKSSGLATLLREVGDVDSRLALRRELLRRPLGSETVLEAGSTGAERGQTLGA